MVPDLLDRIDLRRVRRQEVEFQTPLRALDELPDHPAAVDGVTVHDQKDRPRLVMQEPLRNAMRRWAFIVFSYSMNRNSPRGLMAPTKLSEKRAPVAGTTGVLPLGAHVVPT